MAITKTVSLVQDWTAVAQNAMAESATLDCSLAWAAWVQIQAFLDAETAHAAGTSFFVQARVADADDEDWATIAGPFSMLLGTANSELIDDNPLAAGATTILLSDTTGYTVNNLLRGIEGTVLANSELVRQKSVTTNTNITILDGVKNSHANTEYIYSIADERLISIPCPAKIVRVVVDNTVVPAGSTLNYKVNGTVVTGSP